MGLIAAIAGLERDSYYEHLGRGRFAVIVKTPVRRIMQTVNYVRTKSEDLLALRQLAAVKGTQTPVEFLLSAAENERLRFRIFFSHFDTALIEDAAERLAANKPYYPLYLGITECIASAEFITFTDLDECRKIPEEKHISLDSVLNTSLLKEMVISPDKPTPNIVRERAPHNFGEGRKLCAPASLVYGMKAQPLHVRLNIPAYAFVSPEGQEETIAFLEG
jgi:CRISPR-associated protein Cas5h